MDEITELADRALEKLRRGEELGLEFEIDWASRIDEERDEFMVPDGAAGRSWEGTV